MRLSDKQILEMLEQGELVIACPNNHYPFDRNGQIQPCSIDLRLDNKFYRFKDNVTEFDISNISRINDYFKYYDIPDNDKIVIQPGEAVFGQIYEQLRIPSNCSGMIEGRSRLARLGLAVHATGGFINPGFEGAMPLQIINNNRIPIIIKPYISICQLILIKLTSKPQVPYNERTNSPYNRETLVGLSVLGLDKEIRDKDLLRKTREERLLNKYATEIEYRNKMTQHTTNIVINDSSVGVVNTGEIEKIEDVSINANVNSSDKEITAILNQLIKLVNQSNEVNDQYKTELEEQLNTLIEQVSTPKEKKLKKSTIKAILTSIQGTIGSFADIATIWSTVGGSISQFFGC